MDKSTLKKALEAYNTDPKDAAAAKTITKQLGDLAVIHCGAGGKVDVDETLDSAEFAIAENLPGEVNCITAAQLLAETAPTTPTDPITGAPLRKGKTTSYPQVDWNPVSLPRRLTAAYAEETGQLPAGGSEQAAFQLQQATLQPPWNRLDGEAQKLVQEVDAAGSKATPAQRELLARCRARLSRPAREPTSPAPRPPAPPRPARPEPLPFPQPISRDGSPAAPAPRSSARVFILAHQEDRRAHDGLLTHLGPGRVPHASNLQVPVGQDSRAWVKNQIAASLIVIVLTSAYMLSNDELVKYIAEARNAGKIVVPWIVRPCIWQNSEVGSCEPLGGNRPIDDYQAAVLISEVFNKYSR